MSDDQRIEARTGGADEDYAPPFVLGTTAAARRALAHALRNPLTPIRGYAELLLARLDAVAPAERALFARALDTIFREARRLEATLDTLDADEACAADGTDGGAGGFADGDGDAPPRV
jgi:hypothetical protein